MKQLYLFQLQHFSTDYSVVTWIGIAILAGMITWISVYLYRNPNETLGDVLGKVMFREKFTLFLGLTFLVNFGEAVMAASIHPEGEAQVNGLARILTHLSLSAVSIVSAMWAGHLTLEHFTRDKKEPKATMWIRASAILVTILAAVALPYLNLVIISGGLNETHHLAALIGGAGAAAFNYMSYPMQASCGGTVAHYILILIDSIYTLYQAQMGDTQRLDVHTNIQNRSRKQKEEDLNKFEDNVRFLLVRYSYKQGKLTNKIQAAQKAMDELTRDQHKFALATRAATLVGEIQKWDKNIAPNLSSDEKKKQKDKFLNKIFQLFKNSPNGGKGFGMQLSQPPKID